MATKRDGPEKEKKHKFKHRVLSSHHAERLKASAEECEEVIEREQARLWAELQQVEAALPTGDVAQRNRALNRIYADLVANSAMSSFCSSERSRQMVDTKTARNLLGWLEEQRRLERAVLYAKMRSAGLYLFAPWQDVGILIRVGRLLGAFAWLPLLALARVITLTTPIVRMMDKHDEA